MNSKRNFMQRASVLFLSMVISAYGLPCTAQTAVCVNEGVITQALAQAKMPSAATIAWDTPQDLYSDKVIDGDLIISEDVDLSGCTLTVHGNLYLEGGTLYIDGGTLIVDSSFRIQARVGKWDVKESEGCLKMTKSADSVLVKGSFITQSTYQNQLTAGKLEVKGDFSQISTNASESNFAAGGSHLTILSGTKKQSVTFESFPSSYFNKLELTKYKGTGYTFSPDICWNGELIEDVPTLPLANKSSISATEANVNDTVTITGAAEGGSGGYSYEFYYKKSSDSSYNLFSTQSPAYWIPTESGVYNLRAVVTDSDGSTQTKDFQVTVSDNQLVNNSTIDVSNITLGGSAIVTGIAEGGTGSYTYEFYYKKSSDSSYTLFSTQNPAVFTPNEAGTFDVRAVISDSAGNSQAKDFQVTATVSQLVNNSTVSSSNVELGQSVTVTGSAAGGSGNYTYEFYYRKHSDSLWTQFGSQTSAVFKPSELGVFDLRVVVTDGTSTPQLKEFQVTAVSSLVNNTSVSTTMFNVGQTVKVTGSASGGSGNYTYKFYYKRSTSDTWTSFGSGNTAELKPSSAGTFDIKAEVSDGTGVTETKEFQVTAVKALANNSTVSTTSFNVGQTVKVTGSASGGSGSYTYKFYYKRSTSDTWTSFGSGSTAELKPSSAGTFDIKADVFDTMGNTQSKQFQVTAVKPLANNSTINSTVINLGQKFSVTGAASGGSGTYTYRYYHKRSTATSWTEFGTGSKGEFKPSAAGSFSVRAYVYDGTGNKVYKEFQVKVVNGLVNNSTISSEVYTVGQAVTVTGAAAGGTGSYTYKFYYSRIDATSWTGFGSGTTATLKPSLAGIFDILVEVYDSSGTMESKKFRITPAAALTNKSTISSTSVTVGQSVTVTGAAEGGTGSYTYQFFYRRTTSSDWSSFGSGNTAELKPSSAGIFDILVYAVDGSGEMELTSFRVTAQPKTQITNKTTVSGVNFKVGQTVTVKGAASGGSGNYTYEFYYKRSTANTWTKFGSETSATFKPSSAGKFNILVYVKDSVGNAAVKSFTLTASK